MFERSREKEPDIYRVVRERETETRKKKNTWSMRSVDGKRRGGGRETKSEGMKGAGAKNVKSVHKYRGPEHITRGTGPLILTPAVLVAMDTSQLGPFLRPPNTVPSSSGLSLRHLTRAPEKAVIMRLSAASAGSSLP